MRVRLTDIDSKLPNLALMRLARWHGERGDEVHFHRTVSPDLFEPEYDVVYGSALFTKSASRVAEFRRNFPGALVGGTGSGSWATLEEAVPGILDAYDYGIYPDCDYSIGFLQRGCRLKCDFCVVPRKEGRPWHNMTVAGLWRGEPWPRKLHLLDNDFFALGDLWPERIREIREGGFRVCLTQGINVRAITEAAAEALRSIEYRCGKFRVRRLYTAWDNIGHEKVFMRGLDRLVAAGIPPKHVMVYMLIGYDPEETWERIMYRFERLVERGVLPYPMVYNDERKDLKKFQRWAVRGLYRVVPFAEYDANARRTA